MNERDRWLINLGFDAGWDAHEAYVETEPTQVSDSPESFAARISRQPHIKDMTR